jgi:hypothetical protein
VKKREWDKDIFNYEKAREWLGKNHLPLIFFLAIFAIPVLFIATRFAVTHFPGIPDASIAGKITNNAIDFVTPALYYFSSIAQTMGAIIGLALAAMYAIMPNIRSSKDNPACEPARRLLQRDEYFRRSINVGSVCILVSLLGLLFIYITASSQSWAFVLLLFLGVTALALGVYSLGTMFYFIRVRMPKYFSSVEILELAFKNFQYEIRIKTVDDALDFAEISLLTESLGLEPLFKNQVINILKWSIVRFEDNNFMLFETYLKNLISRTKYDIKKNKFTTEENYDLYTNLAYSLLKSFVDYNWLSERREDVKDYATSILLKTIYDLLCTFTNSKTQEDLFCFINYKLLHLLDVDYLGSNVFDFLNLLDRISLLNENIIDIFPPGPIYEFKDVYMLDKQLFIDYLINIIINNNDNADKEEHAENVLKIIFRVGINNIEKYFSSLDNRYDIELNLRHFKSYSKMILTLESQCNFKPFYYLDGDNFKYVNGLRYLLDLKPAINNIFDESYNTKNFEGIIKVIDLYSTYLLHKAVIHGKTSNLKSFIYDYFIPYLERHGIDVEGNPEYMAIIRKRIKDIKEPELDN